MKRELKFRDIREDKETKEISFYYYTLDELWAEDSWQGKLPYTVIATEQYIGLKDKNGLKEIYEGDVVKIIHPCWHENNVIVLFENGSFIFKTKKESIIPGWTIYKETWKIEVIGNIHEEPKT